MSSDAKTKDPQFFTLEKNLPELKKMYDSYRTTREYELAFSKKVPLVSICVSTYNRCDLLIDRCLKSLMNQSYTNLEIIIVGDHCTDETEYRLSKITDSRIRFRNLPQRGPYPKPGRPRWLVAGTIPTNFALEISSGDFIAHLDDDDQATPDRIEKLLEAAITRKADFLSHSFLAQYPDGTWDVLGTPQIQLGQITTGSIFYHNFFKNIPWDLYAFRMDEPGDWNRIRKILYLKPNTHFINNVLTIHFSESQSVFLKQYSETFLPS